MEIIACPVTMYKFRKKQRALILQGGGALGAFEVGVFRAIY